MLLRTLHEEDDTCVSNQVWEVTRMTWPEPFNETMDRSRVKLIRADKRFHRAAAKA